MYRDVTLTGPLTLKMTVFYEMNGPREDGLDVPFNTPDTLRFDTPEANMQFRIDLLDPTAPIDSVAAGDVLVNVFHTAESDPAVLEPTEISIDVSEYAGQTVRLRLAEVGNQAPIRAGVDNIRFEPLAPGASIELVDAADATGAIVLDDFEFGTLEGWESADSGAGDWYVYSDGKTAPDPVNSDRLDPFSVPDPPQGEFAVVTDTNNPGTHILYRDVTLTGPLTLKMTVFYETNGPREDGLDVPFNTPDTLTFDTPEANMQFRIDLLDPAAPIESVAARDVLVNVFHTAESDPAVLEPTEITVDVSEYAGQTVRLRLAEAGNQAPIRAGVDNIRFESPAPGAGIEPVDAAPSSAEPLQLWDPRVLEAVRLGVGLVGLPPVGARASVPERGGLVLNFGPCETEPDDGLSVFADGRLIWAVSGRFLEQRLTPEGVELMRSELLGSELLGTHDDECVAGAYHGHIMDGGETHSDGFTAPADAHIERLANPASWLPASAWEDREIRVYVPSEYRIYLSGNAGLERLAAELPAAAEELVLTKQWEAQGSPPEGQVHYTQTNFTTEEARAFADALEGAGFEQDEQTNTSRLEFHRAAQLENDPASDDGETDTLVSIELRPLLPHEAGRGGHMSAGHHSTFNRVDVEQPARASAHVRTAPARSRTSTSAALGRFEPHGRSERRCHRPRAGRTRGDPPSHARQRQLGAGSPRCLSTRGQAASATPSTETAMHMLTSEQERPSSSSPLARPAAMTTATRPRRRETNHRPRSPPQPQPTMSSTMRRRHLQRKPNHRRPRRQRLRSSPCASDPVPRFTAAPRSN